MMSEIGDTQPAWRRAHITWAADIEPEPVNWMWQPDEGGRIPAGSFAMAAGREGTGKSSFGIWMAALISRGGLPGAYAGRSRAVLYVAVEDSWKHTLVPRLLAAGADLGKVGRFDVLTSEDNQVTLSLPLDNAVLETAITENDVGLVVIDPLMSVISDRIDTHRERDVRKALDPLAGMMDRTGAVLLGIAHFGKGQHPDAASLITGSGAFKNVPRAIFAFAADDVGEPGQRILTQVKNSLGTVELPSLSYRLEEVEVGTRHGPATTSRFLVVGTSERSVHDILRDSRFGDTDATSERNEAVEWLVAYLEDQGGAARAHDIIKAARVDGIAEATLKRARTRAGVKSKRVGFGQGTIWSLDL